MGNKEKEVEKNPYLLSKEELTCPDTGPKKWFKQLAAKQREGIDHGVRPQLPRDLPPDLWRIWRGRVWKYYVDQQPFEVRQVIMRTVDSEIEWERKKSKDPFRETLS